MPVNPTTLAAFSAASFLLLVIPGPTIVMVVGQALAHGRRAALASVAGVALGDLAAATLSLIGIGALLAASATVFLAVKWVGALYLVYLGIRMWRTPMGATGGERGRHRRGGPARHDLPPGVPGHASQSEEHRLLRRLPAAVHPARRALPAAGRPARRLLRAARHAQRGRLRRRRRLGAPAVPAGNGPAAGRPRRRCLHDRRGHGRRLRASGGLTDAARKPRRPVR